MENLNAAKQALEDAKNERDRYRKATNAAGNAGNVFQAERLDLRAQRRDAAIAKFLGDDTINDEDIFAMTRRINEFAGAVEAADMAFQKLEARDPEFQKKVQLAQNEYDALKETAETYVNGKAIYRDAYLEAQGAQSASVINTTDRAATTAQRARILRRQMLELAQRLGCMDDCNEFLASVESGA